MAAQRLDYSGTQSFTLQTIVEIFNRLVFAKFFFTRYRGSDIPKRNGRLYHYLNVRINSVNDASISCKHFLNFGSVTPELTELICERLV